MIPSPLSMLILGETGEITHTITGDDIPGGEEVLYYLISFKNPLARVL